PFFFLTIHPPPRPTLFPYTTLFRSVAITDGVPAQDMMTVKRYLWRYSKERRTRLIGPNCAGLISAGKAMMGIMPGHIYARGTVGDRKSTRLNSSHSQISYAVFCLKK